MLNNELTYKMSYWNHDLYYMKCMIKPYKNI